MSTTETFDIPQGIDTPNSQSQISENQDQTIQEVAPLSEREIRRLQLQAMQAQKNQLKDNKATLAAMALEDEYWKYKANIPKYRYETMYYTLEAIKIEKEYEAALAKLQEEKEKA